MRVREEEEESTVILLALRVSQEGGVAVVRDYMSSQRLFVCYRIKALTSCGSVDSTQHCNTQSTRTVLSIMRAQNTQMLCRFGSFILLENSLQC